MSKLFFICLIFLTNFTMGHPTNAMYGDDGEITTVAYTKAIMRDESVAREQLYNDLTTSHTLNWNQVIAETKQSPDYIERGYGKRTRHTPPPCCGYCKGNHNTYTPWCSNCQQHHNADPWCPHHRQHHNANPWCLHHGVHDHASDPWCVTCKVHHTVVVHDQLIKAALEKLDENPSSMGTKPVTDTELKFDFDDEL